jgi:LmbE family N-acetylglucosaminyl deacetylase
MEFTEGWDSHKEILIILAHPDDPEYFLGATIARWVKAGHTVRYILLTKGDKGAQNEQQTIEEIISIRKIEQEEAIKTLGVNSVDYLDYEDGYLWPDLKMRRQIVRCIRKYKPQIVVTCDPRNLFPNEHYINHPDHRAAGQVVLDSVFPAAGNHLFFPELIEQGYMPHHPEEVWMSLTNDPDMVLDVTETLKDKIAALKKHASQIGDPKAFEQHMLERVEKAEDASIKYVEKFKTIKFRRPDA